MGCNKSLATFQPCLPALAAIKHKVVARRIAASKSQLLISVRSRLLLEANRRKVCCSLRRNRLIRETSCQASNSPMLVSTLPQSRAAATYRPIRAVAPRCLLVAA